MKSPIIVDWNIPIANNKIGIIVMSQYNDIKSTASVINGNNMTINKNLAILIAFSLIFVII